MIATVSGSLVNILATFSLWVVSKIDITLMQTKLNKTAASANRFA